MRINRNFPSVSDTLLFNLSDNPFNNDVFIKPDNESSYDCLTIILILIIICLLVKYFFKNKNENFVNTPNDFSNDPCVYGQKLLSKNNDIISCTKNKNNLCECKNKNLVIDKCPFKSRFSSNVSRCCGNGCGHILPSKTTYCDACQGYTAKDIKVGLEINNGKRPQSDQTTDGGFLCQPLYK